MPVETEKNFETAAGLIASQQAWKKSAIERETIVVGVEQHKADALKRAEDLKKSEPR